MMSEINLTGSSAPSCAKARFRVAVMGHFILSGRVGGAEHMLYNLVRGLAANEVETEFHCGHPTQLSTQFRSLLQACKTISLRESGGTGSRFLAEQRSVLQTGLSADAILFPQYYVPPVIPRRLGTVGTVIHDFQYRHYPQYFSRKKRLWLRAAHRLACLRADRLIVISDFVRQDAERWLGRRAGDKLTVIPNAISWERFAGAKERARPCERPYILSVAAQYPHKNLVTLIRAFADLARRRPDLLLVICGQSFAGLHGVAGGGSDFATLIAELQLTDRVRLTGYVDDAGLGCWLTNAELFAFPSIFEGFGMPPVEALGLGLPVLTTGCTALPEVTRGLAQIVEEPLNAAAWAARLDEMLAHPARFRPPPKSVDNLRAFYAPARIAALYVDALASA